MTPTLSIIIPTRNRRESLLETLQYLRRQRADHTTFEIVVVADGCTDGTSKAVARLAADWEWAGWRLRAVEQGWSGASAARNTGLRAADGEIVLFLDDDILAEPELVEAHLRQHAVARDAIVVLGRLVPEPGPGALHRELAAWWRGHYARLAGRPATFTDLYTGNVSVRRDAALAAGGFDEAIDYEEDVEFGFRLSRRPMEFVYAPEAIAHARNPKPAAALLRDVLRSGRGAVQIYRKFPATLSSLPLGAFGETNLRLRLVRGALLRASESVVLARLIDRAFIAWARSDGWQLLNQQLFELARTYWYWRGVRAEVSNRDEWARLASPGVPILTYHSVQPRGRGDRDRYTVETPRFRSQMVVLKRLGYRVVALEVLMADWDAGLLPPSRTVAITFDDGYRDNLTEAWPVLREFGFPATLFCVTGLVGHTNDWDRQRGATPKPLLDWEELRALDRQGFRVGAHTVHHVDLRTAEPTVAEYEIAESRRQLEAWLDRPVALFAYPYGRENARVREQVREAGFAAAFSVRRGLNTSRTERYALRRVTIGRGDHATLFALKLWVGDNPFRYPRGIDRAYARVRRAMELWKGRRKG